MGTTARFIPTSDAEKGIWLNNFTAKLAVYAAVLGITPAEITALQKDNTFFQFLISTIEMFRQYLLNLAGYKNMAKHANAQQHIGAFPAPPAISTIPAAVAEGIFDRVSKLAIRIKASANYTDNIGSDLGIISPVQTFDPALLQPELKITLDGDRPHIKCTKGYSDAIDLYVDRKDGAGFVLIGRLTKPDYIDVADLPANVVLTEWDYKARYVIANSVVGTMSSVVSIIVKKQ